MVDYAQDSQALRDFRRATIELDEALAAGAGAETIADLVAVRAAAEDRVLVLRRRAG